MGRRMPRYNVKLPDGRWQVFSTVVDDFVSEPMTFDELREWRRAEYISECDKETDSLLTDRPLVNRMDYSEVKAYLKEMEEGGD